MSSNESSRNGHAVILAAGRGTRMRSRLAKVLHPILGRPMVVWPAEAAESAGLSVVLVVHHQEDAVRAAMEDQRVSFARQEAPQGTGDAVASALAALPEAGTVVVLNGDGPLVRASTLEKLLEQHARSEALLTVVSMMVDEPGSYGRIVRSAGGGAECIVEAAHATPEELALNEVNTGLYAMDLAWLRGAIARLEPHPPKGEYYLTDCVAFAAAEGRAGVMILDDPEEALGVNSQVERAVAAGVLQNRIVHEHMRRGVAFEDPSSVTVEPGVMLGSDAWIERGVVLRGQTSVGEGCRIGAYSVLIDAQVSPSAVVLPHSVLESARVGAASSVGPFARLRPGTVLGTGCKVGNFVETKKTTLEDGAKASHLTYLGDARIGAGANVGAGTITCNYDGYAKHRTEIGAGAFIGSNSALVAPLTVGDGAIVGAGSVVINDVEADAIVVARGEERVRSGAAARFRRRRSPRSKKD
ncbi:MAG: UDP-N-acetylglucosamine diphosphorylase/glucosamine-1-phosphate N-acetyltransferase [Deltaproteobacteria bacterium]|nr:UDP-N-acetylglucosamine diphosphorylase/glucosamine-1-phosphate N-acetyltransferase [Deltaproteobacteria bacterium]HCH63679.1 UDP-N-acetylglucosamine diphosphorylase/glucosamine-1-phosphate N-acetyltransferase [Deltaproteobacteria bacterium]